MRTLIDATKPHIHSESVQYVSCTWAHKCESNSQLGRFEFSLPARSTVLETAAYRKKSQRVEGA